MKSIRDFMKTLAHFLRLRTSFILVIFFLVTCSYTAIWLVKNYGEIASFVGVHFEVAESYSFESDKESIVSEYLSLVGDSWSSSFEKPEFVYQDGFLYVDIGAFDNLESEAFAHQGMKKIITPYCEEKIYDIVRIGSERKFLMNKHSNIYEESIVPFPGPVFEFKDGLWIELTTYM